jgi:hypothetical protein
MRKMLMLFVVMLTALAFGSGCATLGWKPSEDQLLQYEQNLGIANFTEAGLFVVFDSLCSSQTLDEKSCVAGYAADVEWDSAYALAVSAIADYRAGKGDQETMQKYVSAAMTSALRIVALIKNLSSSKAATAQMKAKGKAMAPKPVLIVPKK